MNKIKTFKMNKTTKISFVGNFQPEFYMHEFMVHCRNTGKSYSYSTLENNWLHKNCSCVICAQQKNISPGG